MKRKIQIAFSIPLICLLLLFSAFSLFLTQESPARKSEKKGKGKEVTIEKSTIIPFILLGGIHYLRKAVEKK